ncbi:GDSL esterase/lipase [Camellia lanceoleosa]|uniref:GDSL esterase/lipase n=1 Tax=Camellia lanceoleosa TaxID=1840588 RepID=A0ACC0HAM3_9ERIC|nr:GDSL esterase/lipase [Camellia lanceoleosa]
MKMTVATTGKRRSTYNGGGPSGPGPIPKGRKMRQTTTTSINVTCSTPHPCCSPLLLILQKLVWISKTNVQLSDNGFVICIGQASRNNNNIEDGIKANFYPYGIDYNNQSTGRFTNGLTAADS